MLRLCHILFIRSESLSSAQLKGRGLHKDVGSWGGCLPQRTGGGSCRRVHLKGKQARSQTVQGEGEEEEVGQGD